jgi:hypothetical protein
MRRPGSWMDPARKQTLLMCKEQTTAQAEVLVLSSHSLAGYLALTQQPSFTLSFISSIHKEIKLHFTL